MRHVVLVALAGCNQLIGIDDFSTRDASAIDATLDGVTDGTRDFDAPDGCYGASILFLCPTSATTVNHQLDGLIDTDHDVRCDGSIDTTTCVIYGQVIVIAEGATVTTQGKKPLVLLATETMSIGGTLDLVAHGLPPAGARNLPTAHLGSACGGGEGGTFGTRGGDGGGGMGCIGAVSTGTGSMGSDPVPLSSIVGGVSGGPGNDEISGGQSPAGGAIYLVTKTLSLHGRIDASGRGGGGGENMGDAGGGGGGGGSGGLVWIHASTIAADTATILALGGGGGEGGGSEANGAPGMSPTTASAAPGGSGGTPSGGDGGIGAGSGNGAGSGAAGTRGGGGGGGGLGIVRVTGGGSLSTATVAPPPS